jgi:cytochrome c5
MQGDFNRGVIVGIVGLIIAGVAIGAVVLFTGVYNMAASVPHTSLGLWVFETGKVKSIQAHAKGVKAPDSFTDKQIADGAPNYGINCSMCHGPSAGTDGAPFIKGMYPEPPNMSTLAVKYTPAELFWIAKNGLKMTGMPAVGSHISDDQLWTIVAYLEKNKKE